MGNKSRDIMNELDVRSNELVPQHIPLSREEEKELLKKLGVRKGQLPKIRKSDPCIKILEQIGEVKEGQIIKIVRNSRTARISTAYRMVIKG